MFDQDDLERIREGREDWEASEVEPVLDRFGERKDEFTTDTGGHEVKRLYTPNDVAELDYEDDLGFPAEDPYTRGVYSTGYRGRLWTMRQYAGMGTPAETNERFNYLMDEGQTGLSMAFDLPTQMGHDSDDEMSAGALIVIDVDTSSRGMPSNTVSMSARASPSTRCRRR